jgi:hypothetical protein
VALESAILTSDLARSSPPRSRGRSEKSGESRWDHGSWVTEDERVPGPAEEAEKAGKVMGKLNRHRSIRRRKSNASLATAASVPSFDPFTPFLDMLDAEILQAYLDELVSDVHGARKPLKRLEKARCPVFPLVSRLFLLTSMYRDRSRPRRVSRLGGLKGKMIEKIARSAEELAAEIQSLNESLADSAARTRDLAAPTKRMLELPRRLKEFTQDVRKVRWSRLTITTGQPNPLMMYKAALVEFVKGTTGRLFYGTVGTLVECALSLEGLEETEEKQRSEFTDEAIRKAVERDRELVLAGMMGLRRKGSKT